MNNFRKVTKMGHILDQGNKVDEEAFFQKRHETLRYLVIAFLVINGLYTIN